jgi:hypothetical protein
MAFGHRARYTSADYATMKDLLYSAEVALLHTNDYYSWKKEKWQGNGRIVSFISFYMQTKNLSEEEAIEKAKQTILEFEQRFVKARENLYHRNPSLPFYLRQWAEVCGATISGYHYWSANCPRYNSFDDQANASDKMSTADNEPLKEMSQKSDHGIIPSLESDSSSTAKIGTEPSTTDSSSWTSGNPQCLLNSSVLFAPTHYMKSLSSKNVRSQLIEAFNSWLLVSPHVLSTITQVIDDLHNSSLILDDIQDDSKLRRRNTTAHLIFGTGQSINSATYMFVHASKLLCGLQNHTMIAILLEELENLFVGQSWDLHWKFHKKFPAEAEYFEMVDKKTGAMFKLLLRLMQTSASTC